MENFRQKELYAFSLAEVKDFDIALAEAPMGGANSGGDINECPTTPVEASSVSPVKEENQRKLALVF